MDKSLSDIARVTAFVDILGWSALTEGTDSLIHRKMARGRNLTANEVNQVAELSRRLEVATRLDRNVAEIVAEARSLATPWDVMDASTDAVAAKHFLENHHVTFVRVSDNIFLHSSSFRRVVLFVSMLLKRGLDHGILFRAGISFGVVVHGEPGPTRAIDPRSRDVSLFGDGITTAVAAEKAGSGKGVRALVHRRAVALLGDDDRRAVRPIPSCDPDIGHELRWWAGFHDLWPNTDGIETNAPPTEEWFRNTRDRLMKDQVFEWNRQSEKGRRRLADTGVLLEECGASCSTPPS